MELRWKKSEISQRQAHLAGVEGNLRRIILLFVFAFPSKSKLFSVRIFVSPYPRYSENVA